jgi:flagellar capping protein FliD
MTEERRTNGTWHMSKSLSVSHLFTTLAIAVGFFTYVTGIEQDTVVNSMDIKSLSERIDRTEARHSEQFSEIKDMLKSLSVKIDNLALRRERQ